MKISWITSIKWKFDGWLSSTLNKLNKTECKDCKFCGMDSCLNSMEGYSNCCGLINRSFERKDNAK